MQKLTHHLVNLGTSREDIILLKALWLISNTDKVASLSQNEPFHSVILVWSNDAIWLTWVIFHRAIVILKSVSISYLVLQNSRLPDLAIYYLVNCKLDSCWGICLRGTINKSATCPCNMFLCWLTVVLRWISNYPKGYHFRRKKRQLQFTN